MKLTYFSTFSKGAPGSIALNFYPPGQWPCDTACRYHPASTCPEAVGGCYACRAVSRADRPGVAPKLQRHARMGPTKVLSGATTELLSLLDRGKKPPIVRLCAFGSVPPPERASMDFLKRLLDFCQIVHRAGVPIHFPVETHAKAVFYRDLLDDVVVVRESLHRGDHIRAVDGPVSFTGMLWPGMGKRPRGKTRAYALQSALYSAEVRRETTGRKTIICPAITMGWQRKKDHRGKCGYCVACTKPHIDVVYPLH